MRVVVEIVDSHLPYWRCCKRNIFRMTTKFTGHITQTLQSIHSPKMQKMHESKTTSERLTLQEQEIVALKRQRRRR